MAEDGSDIGGRRRKQIGAYEKLTPVPGGKPCVSPHHTNRYVLLAALLASLSSLLLGYDIGVTSGALLFIEEDFGLSSFQQEVFVSSLSLVSLLGALVAGRMSDAIGRRLTIAFASFVFFTGALTMALSPSYTVLMVGRIVTGVGVGFGFTVAPVYTAELAPPSSRGLLVSLGEVFINFGILIGYICSYALKGLPEGSNWRWMLAIGGAPAVIMGLGVFGMPESPRWLVMKGRFQEALEILEKSSNLPEEAAGRLAEIIEAAGGEGNRVGAGRRGLRGEWEKIQPLQESLGDYMDGGMEKEGKEYEGGRKVVEEGEGERGEKEGKGDNYGRKETVLGGKVGEGQEVGKEIGEGEGKGEREQEPLENTKVCGDGVWKELLYPTPAVKRMLFVCLGTNFFQQATGIDAAVYYSPVIFRQAGIHSKSGLLTATLAVGVTKVTFTCASMLLLDRFGRRPLLLTSTTGMTLSLFMESLGFFLLRQRGQLKSSNPLSWLSGGGAVAPTITILAICTFVSSFAVGMGPINWVLTSEIFPLRLRAQAFGIGTAVNRLASGLVALTFLSIGNAVSPAGCFFIFGCIGICSIVFFYLYAPETKGKTLEEITTFFEGEGAKKGVKMDESEGFREGKGVGSEIGTGEGGKLEGSRFGDGEDEGSNAGFEDVPLSSSKETQPNQLLSKLKAIGRRGDTVRAWE